MKLKTVVLPAPFGPIRPTSSSGPISRSSSETAVNPPKRMVQRLRCRSGGRGLAVVSIVSGGLSFPQRPDKQSLWPRQNQDDQQGRIQHHPITTEPAKRLGQHRK